MCDAGTGYTEPSNLTLAYCNSDEDPNCDRNSVDCNTTCTATSHRTERNIDEETGLCNSSYELNATSVVASACQSSVDLENSEKSISFEQNSTVTQASDLRNFVDPSPDAFHSDVPQAIVGKIFGSTVPSESFATVKIEVIDEDERNVVKCEPLHRMENGVDSDSDSTSSATSDVDDLDVVDKDHPDEPEKQGILGNPRAGPVVRGEITVYDLPAVAELNIDVDENLRLTELGSIISIVDTLVVVKAKPGVEALDEETILFLEERKLFGKIFETFGPVISPFYVVRFNSVDEIKERNVKLGDKAYFAPFRNSSLTNYIFLSKVSEMKGSDASTRDNHEPAADELDYSDDEQEKIAKAKMRAKNRDPNGQADDGPTTNKVRKPRKKQNAGYQNYMNRNVENSYETQHTCYHQPTFWNQQGANMNYESNPHYPQTYQTARYQPSTSHRQYQTSQNQQYQMPHDQQYQMSGDQHIMYSQWNIYNAQWTSNDSSYYATDSREHQGPRFVDNRFVQNKSANS